MKPKPRSLLLGLAAVAFPLLCFWRVCSYDFLIYDDTLHIRRNPYFQQGAVSNIARFWKAPWRGLYMPVTYTVWAGVAGMHPRGPKGTPELHPAGFHALNLGFHLLSVLLVFVVLRKLLGHDWAAFGGALLFGLHPLQVESVAWISEFKGVLAGCLSLVAVWQYVSYTSATSGRRWVHYGLAVAAFAAALLSKPSSAVVPVLAAILAVTLLKRPWKRTVTELAPWLLLAVPVMIGTKLIQPDVATRYSPPLWWRPLIAGDALTFYLSKLCCPVALGPDYGQTPQAVLSRGWVFLTGLLPFACIGLVLWRARRPWLVAAAGIFVVALLPVLGLVSFEFQKVSTVADRYAYVALLGPAIALAWFIAHGKRRVVLPVCIVLLAFFGVRSAVQVPHWRDTPALSHHALTVNPNSIMAHINLGAHAQLRKEMAEAAHWYTGAIRIDPDEFRAHYNLGAMAQKDGDLSRAAGHYRDVLRCRPGHTAARYELGTILFKQGELDEAFEHLSKALRLTPHHRDFIYTRLGMIREKQGTADEAAAFYTRALRVNPQFRPAQEGLRRVQVAEDPQPD